MNAPTLQAPDCAPFIRIGELARRIGETPATVRFWEGEFGIHPSRSKKGQRVYSRAQVVQFMAIRQLLREWRFTIAGAKVQLRGRDA